MRSQNQDLTDEIDLGEIVIIIWQGKWKIFAVTAICLLAVSGALFFQKVPRFIATTIIKPIKNIDHSQYEALNSLDFFLVYPSYEWKMNDKRLLSDSADRALEIKNVKSDNKGNTVNQINKQVVYLLDEFADQLESRELFENAFRKFKVLDRKKFKTDTAFNDAIVALASSIKIRSPLNDGIKRSNKSKDYWTIEFEHNDREQWKRILLDVEAMANAEVRERITVGFGALVESERMRASFELQDQQTVVANLNMDFQKQILGKLSFLREQSAIARKLGIAELFFNLEGRIFPSTTAYYLRGFKAIDQEILMIEKRKKGSFPYERSELSRFIAPLEKAEKRIRAIKQFKTYDRAEKLFSSNVLVTGNNFYAASVKVAATNFESLSKRNLYLFLAGVLGGFIGLTYVLIENVMSRRTNSLKN